MNLKCLSDGLPLLLVLLFVSSATAINGSEHWELKLFNDVMSKYNRNIRPVKSPNDTLTASTFLALSRIESVSEAQQFITTLGYLLLVWKDEIFQWNPEDYGGLESITATNDVIWTPEIVTVNSVYGGTDMTIEESLRVTCSYNGECFWSPNTRWTTHCHIDVKYFPYDNQACEVQFGSWMYGSKRVNLTHFHSDIDISGYIPHEEWSLVSTKIGRSDFAAVVGDSGMVIDVPNIAFQIHIRRNPAFYLINMLGPTWILGILSLMVFWLPPESGEKISLGITLLLAFSVLALIITDITPRSSKSMPVIVIAILVYMSITGMAVMSAIIAGLIQNQPSSKKTPSWCRTLLSGSFANLLCVGRSNKVANNGPESVSRDAVIVDDCNDEGLMHKQMKLDTVQHEFSAYLKQIAEREKAKEEEENNAEDWCRLSAFVDRCIFIICALISIIYSIYVMVTLLTAPDTVDTSGPEYIIK